MKVFVLRDKQGQIVDFNKEIGPLFDLAEQCKNKTGKITQIVVDTLENAQAELQKNHK